MSKLKDLTGKKFGKLTVIELAPRRNSMTMWRCRCDCGNEKEVSRGALESGDTRSCGCIRRTDLTGKRFGRWVAIEPTASKNNATMWICKCDCGTIKTVGACALTSGRSRSCGCLAREESKVRETVHGLSRKRLYRILLCMKGRCYNKHNAQYKNYGGRGIRVCDEWMNNFVSFYNWSMENGYADNLSIDRINNDGDYSPDNCRWVDSVTQANNKRTSRYIEIDGERHTISEWAKIYGVKKSLFYERINKLHWDEVYAITTPVIHQGERKLYDIKRKANKKEEAEAV